MLYICYSGVTALLMSPLLICTSHLGMGVVYLQRARILVVMATFCCGDDLIVASTLSHSNSSKTDLAINNCVLLGQTHQL